MITINLHHQQKFATVLLDTPQPPRNFFMQKTHIVQQLKEELTLRNYSPKTIKAYTGCVQRYLEYSPTPSEHTIRNFLLHLKEQGKASQTIALHLNAIKFVHTHILHSPLPQNIRYPKRTKKLPVVLSREEIQQLIGSIKNFKHKLLISLAYGAGLRVSEVVKLRVGDIHFDTDTIHIKNAKGGKDRITLLPRSLENELRAMTQGRTYSEPVFKSERGGTLSTRTAQTIFKNALTKAGIQKNASFHSLRHSFATHLIEQGEETYTLQRLLGHTNIRTTQWYVQAASTVVNKARSPLDV